MPISIICGALRRTPAIFLHEHFSFPNASTFASSTVASGNFCNLPMTSLSRLNWRFASGRRTTCTFGLQFLCLLIEPTTAASNWLSYQSGNLGSTTLSFARFSMPERVFSKHLPLSTPWGRTPKLDSNKPNCFGPSRVASLYAIHFVGWQTRSRNHIA